MIFRTFSIFIVAVLASGCATVTRGSSESYAIESEPPGASVTLSNGLACTTPCSLKVKRRGDFTVTFNKDGYEPVVATVTSSIDGAGSAGMAGNVLLGGIIGAGVDAGTGAMHSHKPNPLTVKMQKIGAEINASAAASISNVYDDLSKLSDLRDKGVLTDAEFETQKAKLLGTAPAAAEPLSFPSESESNQ